MIVKRNGGCGGSISISGRSSSSYLKALLFACNLILEICCALHHIGKVWELVDSIQRVDSFDQVLSFMKGCKRKCILEGGKQKNSMENIYVKVNDQGSRIV